MIVPAGVIFEIRLLSNSVNQTLPSGPPVRRKRRPVSGMGNSVIVPAVVMRPIWAA